MYQHNEHKRAIIESLPGFVESAIDLDKRNTILNKLIDMVIQLDETSIIGKSKSIELKTSNDVNSVRLLKVRS